MQGLEKPPIVPALVAAARPPLNQYASWPALSNPTTGDRGSIRHTAGRAECLGVRACWLHPMAGTFPVGQRAARSLPERWPAVLPWVSLLSVQGHQRARLSSLANAQ